MTDRPFHNVAASKSFDQQTQVAQKRRSTDWKALKLWKGRSVIHSDIYYLRYDEDKGRSSGN